MSHAEVLLDRIVDVLAERVAARVLARLGTAVTTKVVYTTSKRGPHVPGKSRAWMMRNVKAMPGARRVGRDWCIDAPDFEAWARALDRGGFDSRARVEPRTDVELADRFLKDAGHRSTRKQVA